MKYKGLIIVSLVFFLIINTTYYWEGKVGVFGIIVFLTLMICFIALTILLIRQLYLLLRERPKKKKQVLSIVIIAAVLTSAFFFPRGIIDFEKFESDNVLIAQREGVANCMTTVKLREDSSFVEREVCFGITETTGKYRIKGDTVFFERNSIGRNKDQIYRFAVIKPSGAKSEKYLNDLVLFRNTSDTSHMILPIIKNNLK